MIFVPEKEKCILWNDSNEYKKIFIQYKPDLDENTIITFEWSRTPKYNSKTGKLSYSRKYDPFYLGIVSIETTDRKDNKIVIPVPRCLEPACEAVPQLRYNSIYKKYFVCCPSSMLGTKNDCQNEINTYLNKEITNTLFNHPTLAIIDWIKRSIVDMELMCKYFNV